VLVVVPGPAWVRLPCGVRRHQRRTVLERGNTGAWPGTARLLLFQAGGYPMVVPWSRHL